LNSNPFDLNQYDLNIYEAKLNNCIIKEPDDDYVSRMRGFFEQDPKNEGKTYTPPARVWYLEWEMTDDRGWVRTRTIPVPEPKNGEPLRLRNGMFKVHLEAFSAAGTPIVISAKDDLPLDKIFELANKSMKALVGNVYTVQEQDITFFEGGTPSRQVVLPVQLNKPEDRPSNGHSNGHVVTVNYDTVKEVTLDLLDGVQSLQAKRFLAQAETEFNSRGEKWDANAFQSALTMLQSEGLIEVDAKAGTVSAIPF
jgi:hypothetical protein